MEGKLESIGAMVVPLEIVLGRTRKKVGALARITEGTIIEFDTRTGEPADLVAAGEVIAKGEIVIIDEKFGIRVTEVLDKKE
jgi:flagellar motor switch protein FliN